MTFKRPKIMTTQITVGQVKKIATEISRRWKFINRITYYNCIDTKTGQQSIIGGRYNFASYYFEMEVRRMYLEAIDQNERYFSWEEHGVTVSEERKNYVWKIKDEVVRLLCGFKPTPAIVFPK